MKKNITYTLMLFCIIACHAQNKQQEKQIINEQKNIQNMETTTEKIDLYAFNRNVSEYNEYYFNDMGKNVLQYKDGEYYCETRRSNKDLFAEYRRFYSNGNLYVKGYYYYNNFETGIRKEYDNNGKLIKETDYDEPFKNFPWEKVEHLVKAERNIDLYDERTSVYRTIDGNTQKPVWYINWRTKDYVYKHLAIDATNGKIITEEIVHPEK